MKLFKWVLCAGFALSSVAAFAASTTSSSNTAATTSTVTVTVPAVIAIDVESNVTFDLSNTSTYHTPTGPLDCTNAFPPGADCVTATYVPTNVTIPASGTTGEIWVSIFSSKSGQETTMTVTADAPAAFSADPGFVPQAIRLKRGTTNVAVQGAIFGKTSATPIGTTGGTTEDLHASGTMASSVFGWTRIDQIADLALAGNTTFKNVSGSTANITFTLKY